MIGRMTEYSYIHDVKQRIVTISFAAFDLPQINYRMYNGRKYSILYGVATHLICGREAVCPP